MAISMCAPTDANVNTKQNPMYDYANTPELKYKILLPSLSLCGKIVMAPVS